MWPHLDAVVDAWFTIPMRGNEPTGSGSGGPCGAGVYNPHEG